MRTLRVFAFLLCWSALGAQAPVETVPVVFQRVERAVRLPAEFEPFLSVGVRAKITGFVEKVLVDRGSAVKRGQVLLTLTAPEMAAQFADAEAKVQAVQAQRAEAEARLAALTATYDRLKAASATPGVVAGNDLAVAEKSVEAARASAQSFAASLAASRAAAQAIQDMQAYLTVTAPFDGIITERAIHPGALVGPNTPDLLKLEQLSRLRLVVAVPEAMAGSVTPGARVSFSVAAFPGQTFSATVSRISHALDQKTRSMPVELNVANPGLRFAPGMYPEVAWTFSKPRASILVPPSSVATTTERVFVIRANSGRAEWVSVQKGAVAGDLVEVFGPLQPGDVVVKRASDEIREGSILHVQR